MAINLFNKYGSRANPPSIDYPEGSIKNRSAPDVKDGTPLDADWANDHQGFFQSILSYFGVTANGTPDKVGASQYFDALMSDPTEAMRGLPLVATSTEAAALTNVSKIITPMGLKNAFLNNANVASTGYQKLPSGLIIQWGPTPGIASGNSASVIYPVAFTSAIFSVVVSPLSGINATGSLSLGVDISSGSLTSFIVRNYYINSLSGRFIAIGV